MPEAEVCDRCRLQFSEHVLTDDEASQHSDCYVTLHCITLQHFTLHYITLHYITLHYITLHYTILHYIHYIT